MQPIDRIKRLLPTLRLLSFIGLGMMFGSISADRSTSFIFGLTVCCIGQLTYHKLNIYDKKR